MFKTHVEPREAGERSHCKVVNIYDVISIVYESVGHGKLWFFLFFTITFVFFYENLDTKNKKTNKHGHCVTCYVISMVYTLTDHSSRPTNARGCTQLL